LEIINSNAQNIEHSIIDILRHIGEDPEREGLIDTPKRMIKSWKKLFGGYKENAADILKTFSEGTCDEMVILKNVEFYSTCEHHFLPFYGQMSVGYIPNKKIVGISKLARLVEMYARRLQIQERMTGQIADSLTKHLSPIGVMIVCEAQHMCMTSRGVEKQNSKMITSAIRGAFEKPEARAEFLELIR